MAFRAPLLGYNTNVRHKGKLYHIQTEDSGVGYPHIITHLFADGGRIVASKKTSYAEHVGSDNLQDTVKKLMQAQHKAMFIALRDGVYDEDGPNDAARDQAHGVASGEQAGAPAAAQPAAPRAPLPPPAAAAQAPRAVPPPAPAAVAQAQAPTPAAADREHPERTSLYQGTRTASKVSERPAAATPARGHPQRSIFGGDLLSEKSLDEVILSYLATDEPESKS